jgi:plastocyanin
VKLRKRYLPVAAVLGAAVAVVPALAAGTPAPSEVKLEVAQNCNTPNWPCWNPKGSPEGNVGFYEVAPFTIAQGGTISFEDNDSQALTDVVWKGAAPNCPGVEEAPPTKTWSGTCTFATAGEYEFESEGLFNDGTSNYHKYKVIVEGATTGTTPTTPTTPGGGGGTTTSPTSPAGGSGPGAAPSSPLVGSASEAVKLAGTQHGSSVRGSVKISQAGAGDRLEVDLIATTASLAKAGHATQVVGRLVSASVSAGQRSFSVKLNAKAKRALKRRHRLALKVRITLTPAHGEATTVTRSMTLHAGG